MTAAGAAQDDPAGGQVLADTWVECIKLIDSRIVIDQYTTKFYGEDHYTRAWRVSGADLGGAGCRTFEEAMMSWLTGLKELSAIDPEHYARFADLPVEPAASGPKEDA